MRIEILISCVACDHCTYINSDAFKMVDGVATVNAKNIVGNEQDCRIAAEICPASAIKIREQHNEKK